MQLCESIARTLESAALEQNDTEGLAVSDMMHESAQPENFFTAKSLSGSRGVRFDGFGSLTSTNSRIDPIYTAKAARRTKRRVVEALNRFTPQDGERLRLLTLTMPDIKAGFSQTNQLLRYALVLLKKRKWFKRNVRGAVLGVEFTLGAAGNRWHLHAHVLAWANWIDWDELGEQWTSCLMSASRRLVVVDTFTPTTSHGRAVVDVRHVTAKGAGSATVTHDEAVRRVCGYIVKGSDVANVPQSQICEVRRVLDGCRLIETFGACNSQKGRVKSDAASNLVYRDITDGKATIENTRDVVTTSKRYVKRERQASLKDVGSELIRKGYRQEWLAYLKGEFRQRREWRMAHLARANHHATFKTLDGRVWHDAAQ
jgi:hypothetical protein